VQVFNPALGKLLVVNIHIADFIGSNASYQIENLRGSVCPGGLGLTFADTVTMVLEDPNASTIGTGITSFTGAEVDLGPFDGVAGDYCGDGTIGSCPCTPPPPQQCPPVPPPVGVPDFCVCGSGATFIPPISEPALPADVCITNPTLLAKYITPGQIRFKLLQNNQTHEDTACANHMSAFHIETEAVLEISYTYCPACAVHAADDSATVCAGSFVDVPVLANDSTPCGTLDCASLTIVTQPQHGTTQIIGCTGMSPCSSCVVRYTPNAGYTGPDSFVYSVTNDSQTPPCTGQATVNLTVCSTTASNATATVCVNSSVDIPVQATTTCGHINCSSLIISPSPQHGTATQIGSTCTIHYVPMPGYTGPDSFGYHVSNDQVPPCTSNNVTVNITVCGTTANDDSATVCTGSFVNIPVLANDITTCSVLDCASLAIVTPPQHGTAQVMGCAGTGACAGCVVKYTPMAGYVGPDSFTYHVSNTSSPPCTSNLATVNITVCGVTANNDSASVCAGSSVDIHVLSNDSTTCGALDCSSLMIVTPPQHGTPTIVGCTGTGTCPSCVVHYVPAAGYTGTDSFTYMVSNNQSPACMSNVATVSIDVCAVSAVDESVTVCAGTSVDIHVLDNDSTTCGALACSSLTIVTLPSGGTATVTGCTGTAPCPSCVIHYTPHAGFSGSDSFTYMVSNDQKPPCSGQATVHITVCATTASDESSTVCAGDTTDIPVHPTTTCGTIDCSTLAVVDAGPLHGIVTRDASTCTFHYMAFPGYCGPDSFHYTVASSNGCVSNAGTIDVTIKCSPLVVSHKVVRDPNNLAPIVIHVLDQDSAGPNCTFDLGSLSISNVSLHCGTLHVDHVAGTVVFTPAPPASCLLVDSFDYTIANSCGCSGTAHVEINSELCYERNRRQCGSLLLFPEYRNGKGVVTLLTITMGCCDFPTGTTLVELRFIEHTFCSETNQTFTLTPCDTVTLITSAVNSGGPSAQGYAYAYAKNNVPSPNNPTGTPIVFNHLIGQELILDGIEALNYGMNAVSFKGFGASGTDLADGTPNDDDGDGIRDLNGPNSKLPEYEEAPDRILIPRFLGQTPAISDSHLILVNLSGGQAFTTIVSIEGFDDSENPFSATFPFYCWARPSLLEISGAFLNTSLAQTSTSTEIVGANGQKAGWFIVDGLVASSSVESIHDPAIYAVLVECMGPGRCASDLPWEMCSQPNGDLLPVDPLGDGPNPMNGDDQ
jgi:hypothetical protein